MSKNTPTPAPEGFEPQFDHVDGSVSWYEGPHAVAPDGSWDILTGWTPEEGMTISPAMVKDALTPAQAFAMGAALQQLARRLSATER